VDLKGAVRVGEALPNQQFDVDQFVAQVDHLIGQAPQLDGDRPMVGQNAILGFRS